MPSSFTQDNINFNVLLVATGLKNMKLYVTNLSRHILLIPCTLQGVYLVIFCPVHKDALSG